MAKTRSAPKSKTISLAKLKNLPVTVVCEGCGKAVTCNPHKVTICRGYTCAKLECWGNPDFVLPRVRDAQYKLIENAAGELHGYNLIPKMVSVSYGARTRVERDEEVDKYGLSRHHRRVLCQMYAGKKLRKTRGIGWGIDAEKIKDELGERLEEAKMIKTFDGELYFFTEAGLKLGEKAFYSRARDPREWLAKKDIPEFNKRLAEEMTRLRDKNVELTDIVVIEAAQAVLRYMRIDGLHHRDINIDTRPPKDMLNQFRRADRLRKNTGRARHFK